MSLEDRLDKLIDLLSAILVRFAPSPTDPRAQPPFQPTYPDFSPCGPHPSPAVDPPILVGDLWAKDGDELPFQTLGGKITRVTYNMRLVINVPIGFNGRKSISISQRPSPYQTNYGKVTLVLEGGNPLEMGAGGGTVPFPLPPDPGFEGGRSYSLWISFDQPGACDLILK